MIENLPPWELHRDLTENRLSAIANLVADARHECLSAFDEADEVRWGMGCLAYDFTCLSIERAKSRFSWLSVVDRSLRFVFTVGAVPVRFYRGEFDNPPTRALVQSYPELQQLTLAFGDIDSQNLLDLVWRFAIETDLTGEVERVVFFGAFQDGQVRSMWSKTLAPRVANVVPFPTRPGGDGVDLPPPSVGLPGLDENEEREE